MRNRITLTLQIELYDRNNDKNDGDGRSDGENDGEYIDLNNTQSRVYAEIKRRPSAIAASIAETIGLSKPTVERAIATLKKKGYIVRNGSTKTGKWIILK